ncbi:hypothetical protein DDE18_20380 [Nocardioides gansuensis]|uniref:LVIVD repeat-containing protein n=1 Tax=Nocardioides gansuensis TaxID=2138300 RepID=A0A2T8F5F1_9ACTN|nr:hypothetical protein [Nocardioides gansuensis]PVG80929.1 hypothetical protein DDE18_20380 [Nocardioides gansuensis]
MSREPIRLILACLTAILLITPAASAHDDHGGTWEPSPVSRTANLKVLATSEKVFADPTYRNSDLAFWGGVAYAGNYDGFRSIDISDPEKPTVLSDFVCPGSQQDVSVWKGLLFSSIDAPVTGPECGSPRSPSGTPGFEGIRIFDVSNPSAPSYVGAVATDCGSHTHTLVPDPADPSHVYLYVASYPSGVLAESAYGNSCSRLAPDGTQGHSKISVIEVPLADPASAAVVSEPTFELDDFRSTAGFRGCHDISVFSEIQRAAAACMSEGQIWDLSDLERPQTIARVHNPAVEFFHSATFTWDGSTLLFGDEAGGGTSPRCRASDPTTLGAIWIYDMASLDLGTGVEPSLSHFKIPRVQGDVARCTMHNFNVLPVEGRYVAVSAAYSGGTTVFDFTDRSRPVEIAHNDPHGANTWSSYWYNGQIYTNDTGRGFDVMLLSDQARAGAKRLPYLNPQTQEQLIP